MQREVRVGGMDRGRKRETEIEKDRYGISKK
jgi:hypothetical protein